MLWCIRAAKPQGWIVSTPGHTELCESVEDVKSEILTQGTEWAVDDLRAKRRQRRQQDEPGRDSLDGLEAAYRPLVPQVLPPAPRLRANGRLR